MDVRGSLRAPGDKSISHRALIFGALADGRSRVRRILQSADVHSTAGVLRALGVAIPELSDDFVVQGIGVHGLEQPAGNLDCGNSGTTTRLMAGVAAACPIEATFVGDASLSRRPMRRIAKPLSEMGAAIELPPQGGLPMTIRGGTLHHIQWESEVASAQVKSAILLAALVSGVQASVREPHKSRDHTERMLRARDVIVRDTVNAGVFIEPGQRLTALDTDVPSDPSSASFFLALAAGADGGELLLQDVCVNETRIGFLYALRRMGADVQRMNERDEGGEPIADIRVRPAPLRAATVAAADVPSMVDELPLLACLATRADGETSITGANELRVKESDRITAVVSNLRAIGADAEELPDGMLVRGSDRPLKGRIITHGDHRLAMAFGILGALGENEIDVDDRDCVNVSYPGFWADLARVTIG
jgi:3-phosphoshikimate 1-carboxyvinyltransferase